MNSFQSIKKQYFEVIKKMKSRATLLLSIPVIASVLCTPVARGATVFNNGQVNTVDTTVNDFIDVLNGPGGSTTTVIFNTGANVTGTDSQDNTLYIADDSYVVINDGSFINDVSLFDNAVLEIFGGDINDDLYADGDGTIDFYNGRVGDDIEIFGGTVANFYSGVFVEDIEAADEAEVNIFGGTLVAGNDPDTGIGSAGLAVVTIHGSNFKIDGQDVGFGEIASTGGILSGTLSDGSAFSVPFERVNQRFGGRFGPRHRGTIVLVPEPSSLALLGLGIGLVTRRIRRTKR